MRDHDQSTAIGAQNTDQRAEQLPRLQRARTCARAASGWSCGSAADAKRAVGAAAHALRGRQRPFICVCVYVHAHNLCIDSRGDKGRTTAGCSASPIVGFDGLIYITSATFQERSTVSRKPLGKARKSPKRHATALRSEWSGGALDVSDRWEQRMYSRDPRADSGSIGENGSEHQVQEAVKERCA